MVLGRCRAGLPLRLLLLAALASATLLGFATAATAAGLTPGDVVVYRVGAGSTALSSSATAVYLDEFEPDGHLVESIALPTGTNGSNKPLLASGTAGSEGLISLSENGEYLLATGYDTTVGASKVAESTTPGTPRTIARVSGTGEVNTTTALTDSILSANNIRSATSTNGTQIWFGGAVGGVRSTTLGSSTSTGLNETDKNVRAVTAVDGQLYTSADSTKQGVTIATVGSGLPTSGTQTVSNLPFATAPKEPYQYSFLTLGLGPAADTLYVAENEAGAVVKYNLIEGRWVKEGSVAISGVTGLTANDNAGTVTIFATTSGSESKTGTLYEITDSSGFGGTLAGSASAIATAPGNEAYRGIAFAPGTVIGTGSGKITPAPTIVPAEGSLEAAISDPTNPTLGVSVEDEGFTAAELTLTAKASNSSVATAVHVEGSGAQRTLTVTPGSVGTSTITLTAEAPNGKSATTTIEYGVSAYQGDPSDRYYSGAGNGSTAIDAGGGYMIVGDDEGNVLRLYHERDSGLPVKTFDFTSKLPFGATEMDIESSARAGNTLYWMGSLSNSKKGKLEPGRDVLFAATIKGSGANTELEYLGSYTHLRQDLIEWDQANGNPLGFAASTESGVPSNQADGFNVEGLEFAAGSTSTAYVAFRAPLEPTAERQQALLVPVTNFSSLVTDGNPGTTKATFGSALEWNLGGRGIREIRRNASGEYLLIAGTPDDSNSSFGLYAWDGNPAHQPVLTSTPIAAVAEGAWEDIVSVPEPLASGDEVELLEDNGDSVWYADGRDSKEGLPPGLQKDLGRLFTIELPAPSAPGQPQLTVGTTPNANGEFTLGWSAPGGLGSVTYTLEEADASGVWSTVASGLTSPEYSFSGSPESEGTWTFRVTATDGAATGEASPASAAVKVDDTAPEAPTASADRAPDYAGGGGWYEDSVTVSFTANGDPALSDGSPGSGVDMTTLSAPQTFATSGSHTASGTVADNAGNVSAAGTLTVQVDATPPSLEVSCPQTAMLGSSGVTATVIASDGQSGLAVDPSGSVPIDTSSAGPVTTTRTAVDNVGHTSEASCTTVVEAGKVISGPVNGSLVVRAGESVELTSTASVSGAVKVKAGGALDVEGASLSGKLLSNGATGLRLCGAAIAGAVKVTNSTGAVVIGDGGECASDTIGGNAVVKDNTAGVTIEGQTLMSENAFRGALKVLGNQGGTTVTGNEVARTLTVTGNEAPVIDSPNTVTGKSKLQ